MNQALMEECAEWIAGQMEEEGYLIDPGLVHAILEHEWGHPDLGLLDHQHMASRLEVSLAEAGIRGMPETLSASLITTVLSWEDDFLSFAGIARRAE